MTPTPPLAPVVSIVVYCRCAQAMLFCPFCGTHLLLEHTGSSNAYACATCPYSHPVVGVRAATMSLAQFSKPEPDVDDVGAALREQGMPKTAARCDTCGHGTAYFVQAQLRSGDEPPTTIYRCCECGFQWRLD